MRVDDFDFDLPEALIARHPPERRRDARLLALTVDALKHQRFPDLADHLRPGDLLVALSNSGETGEVLQALAAAKKAGARAIGVTGRPESRLGQLSDCVLDIGRVEEACPLKLAPTASTFRTQFGQSHSRTLDGSSRDFHIVGFDFSTNIDAYFSGRRLKNLFHRHLPLEFMVLTMLRLVVSPKVTFRTTAAEKHLEEIAHTPAATTTKATSKAATKVPFTFALFVEHWFLDARHHHDPLCLNKI